MKDVRRVVNTAFWNDDLVQNEFSPEDKYFMLYLLTNPMTTQLGIYHLPIKTAAFELGYSTEAVLVLLDRFESKYKLIAYSKETNEVAIKNYLRHSIVKGGKPVLDCLIKEASLVKDRSLVGYVIDNIEKYRDIQDINNTVLEFIDNIKTDTKYINSNDNDNDNDNERYVHESSTNRPRIVKTPVKHRFGEYKHVFLTDEEYNKLVEKFGEDDTKGMIQFLDDAIEMKGYQYKSHYLVIAKEGNWVRNEYFKLKANRQEKAFKRY